MPPLLRLLVALPFVLAVLTPWESSAQDSPDESPDSPPIVEPSEEQRDLNDDAVRALTDGDYAKAITLLEEALYLGELNVTYLNLGRAYQLLGRCDRARAAFEKSLEAPRAERPPPGLVTKKTREYIDELEQDCKTASESPAGSDASSALPPVGAASPDSEPTPDAYALATTISAGALLAGAGTLHLVARSQRATVVHADTDSAGYVTEITERRAHRLERSANTLDTIAVSAAITGGAVGLLSGYLWMRGGESHAQLDVTPHPSGATLTWRMVF